MIRAVVASTLRFLIRAIAAACGRYAPFTRRRQHQAFATIVIALTLAATTGRADDWPEFRGRGRRGVWTESGIIERFPEQGLKVLWRTPIRAGYTGPAVADGRVFVADFLGTGTLRGIERALALDEKTGTVLWTREWPVDYR